MAEERVSRNATPFLNHGYSGLDGRSSRFVAAIRKPQQWGMFGREPHSGERAGRSLGSSRELLRSRGGDRPRAVSAVVVSACALTIAIFLSWVSAAGADPMAPDPSFGSGGTLMTPIGSALGADDARAKALVLQPDGKLVAAGYAREFRNNKFALARYNTDGSLDTSFNGTGTVMTGVTPAVADGADDEIQSLVVQGDGKLVAAGYAAASGQDEWFVLARYNADGPLDKTFNPNPSATQDCPGTLLVVGCKGVVAAQPGGNGTSNRARSVIVQPDGKYVVGGFAKTGLVTRFALVRYNVNGSLDTTFGSSGKVVTAVGVGGVSGVSALALQDDGKIIAAGTAKDVDGVNRFALARYNPNGSLDTTFGSAGTTTTRVGSGNAELNSLVVDSVGGLVVAGVAVADDDHVFALARYNSNGSLDTSFGSGGKTLTPIGSDGAAVARSVTTQGQQLLAGGVASDAGIAQLAFARYDETGQLDTTFSSTGSVLVPVGNGGFASAASVVSDDSGRPVAAGYASNDGAHAFALARLVPTPPAAVPGPPAGASRSACFKRFTATICPGAPALQKSGSCRVRTRSARMSRSGRVKVRLRCTAAARGMLRLKALSGKKKKTVGRKSFSVKSARSMTVKVKLSKSARKRVRKAKRLRVRATISHKGAAAARATSKKLTIKAPKKTKKKRR